MTIESDELALGWVMRAAPMPDASQAKRERSCARTGSTRHSAAMPAPIDAEGVAIEPERYDAGLNVFALWRGKRVGHASCVWDDAEKTRLLFSDLKVEEDAIIEHKRIFRPERRADFQRLGIGTRLLHEVIRQAPRMGACELFGKVVESDLKSYPGLLDWYAREGFEIGEPIEGDMIPHKKRIVMRFD